MKKVLMIFAIFLLLCPSVKAEDLKLAEKAKSAILIEASTGKILFEKNADEKLHPASMTKMMSMLLIIEAIEDGVISWDQIVTVSENASSMGGSQILLETGEKMSVRDLFKGVAIASGNDAVVALAETVAGNVSNFVSMMNKRASQLGLTHTHFKNPHGLDDADHYSSSRDMSLIARELVKHEKVLEYTKVYEDYLREDTDRKIWLVNTNRLVRFYDGVDGLKTGFTTTAGYCLTATAKKENMRLISVVMGANTSEERTSDTTSLLNYGFNTYQNHTILTAKDILGKKRIENSPEEEAQIALTKDYHQLIKQTAKIPNYSFVVEVEKLVAPLKVGDIVGKAKVIDENGVVVDTLDVTVNKDYPKSSWWEQFLKNFKHLTSGQILIK